ncbi:MgtC/SapB family protein [Povalibacter sp.]|uniref:MgtC/SapB family protein n=1 Tax=Povalibacter sp. TaxID=1962978 RepID=UPI002F3E834D
MPLEHPLIRLAVALGVGLLIGIERERSHADKPEQSSAGVRTFTLTSLTGAISLLVGDEITFIAFGLAVAALITISYRRTHDQSPGMTTEIAQLGTFVLGGLSMREPQLAAALAVVIVIVLAARTKLHHWVHEKLTDAEIRDGLLLAAAALIILPLTPQEAVDPWGVVKPRQLWALAVTIMAINGLGYIALRTLGPRVGLMIAGFFSGFVSSTATTATMAARAKEHPELRRGAVAGATISSVASILQIAILIGLVSRPLLLRMALPLFAAGCVVAVYAALFAIRSERDSGERKSPAGRPFNPKTVLIFVLVIGCALIVSALLTQWLGDSGLLLASAISGLADAHASAVSAASLAANDSVALELAAFAVLIGFSVNTISKCAVAFSVGDRMFGFEFAPGIVLSAAAAWMTLFAQRLLQ